jgi:hypothetical protein
MVNLKVKDNEDSQYEGQGEHVHDGFERHPNIKEN